MQETVKYIKECLSLLALNLAMEVLDLSMYIYIYIIYNYRQYM